MNILSRQSFYRAAAQGILAIECREDNREVREMLAAVCDKETWKVFLAERSFLKAIGGGCNAPAAALAVIENDTMKMQAVYAAEGSQLLLRASEKITGCCGDITQSQAEALGRRLAEELLAARHRKRRKKKVLST